MDNSDEAVIDAVEILVGDHKRKGRLDALDVTRIVEKRRLDERQLEQLLELLAKEGVEFDDCGPPEADFGGGGLAEKSLPKPPTVEEERQLGLAIQAALRLRGGDGPISSQVATIVEQGDRARDELIRRNVRLVYWVARNRSSRSLDPEDIIQEGMKGLIRAVEKYDPQMGYRFSTYASWWIKQAIHRGIDDTADTIRIPVHRRGAIRRLRRMKRQLQLEKGRAPTLRDLAAALDWTIEQTAFIDDLARFRNIEIDAPVAGDGTMTFADLLPDGRPSPEDYAVEVSLRETMMAALEPLPERMQYILRARFGIGTGKSQTLEEVGRFYGVTRERIRQIEAKALRILRQASRRNRLKTFVD